MSVTQMLTLAVPAVIAALVIIAGTALIVQQSRARAMKAKTPDSDESAPSPGDATKQLHRLGPSASPPAPPPFTPTSQSGSASLGAPGITLPSTDSLPNVFDDDEQPTELMTAEHLRRVLEKLDKNPTPGRLVAEDK